MCTGVLFFERRQEHGNTQARDSTSGTFTIFLREYITEKKIFIFSFMDTCASLQAYGHEVCTEAKRDRWFPEVGVRAVVSYRVCVCVLGTEPGFSARVAGALNRCASPAP